MTNSNSQQLDLIQHKKFGIWSPLETLLKLTQLSYKIKIWLPVLIVVLKKSITSCHYYSQIMSVTLLQLTVKKINTLITKHVKIAMLNVDNAKVLPKLTVQFAQMVH